MEQVGKCTKCNRDAAYNMPHVDPDGNLLCDGCSYESEVMVTGVSQFLDDDGNLQPKRRSESYRKLGCTISVYQEKSGPSKSAWTDRGRRAFKMSSEEWDAPYEEILDRLIAIRENGFLRCNSGDCRVELPEDQMKFPLFAGVACPSCWEKHKAKLAQQRKDGKVCRMCRQPWGNCCC